jgi:hypothetical protein
LHSHLESLCVGKCRSSTKCTNQNSMPGYNGSSNISATSAVHSQRSKLRCHSGVQHDWWWCCCQQSSFVFTFPHLNTKRLMNYGWRNLTEKFVFWIAFASFAKTTSLILQTAFDNQHAPSLLPNNLWTTLS